MRILRLIPKPNAYNFPQVLTLLMRLTYLIILVVTACTTNSQRSDEIALESNQQQALFKSVAYRDSLHALPFEFESNRRGLEIFSHGFDKSERVYCDIALKDFLEFQKRLLDELNQELYKNPNFDTINTLIWVDPAFHAAEALQLQNQLKQQGLVFRSTEGTVYIDADTESIRTAFYNHLSEPTKLFFSQYEKEINQGFAEDGGMYISEMELADRLGFWEEFLLVNPNHLFKHFADENIKYYRYYLMVGMDNTPAFDFESGKFLPEYEKALLYYQDRFGHTPSAPIFRAYFEVLAKNDNKSGSEVVKFTDQYLPWDN